MSTVPSDARANAREWLRGGNDLDPRNLIRDLLADEVAVPAGGCAPPVYVDAAPPTADLMRLVEEMREHERNCPATLDGKTARDNTRYWADRLQALSALGEARVGGEHVRTGVFDRNDREICSGDRIVFRNQGPHTKREYWNPEYVVDWKAPAFTLRHVGGGKSSDTAHHGFVLAGKDQSWANDFEVIATPAQPKASEEQERYDALLAEFIAQGDLLAAAEARQAPDAKDAGRVTDAMVEAYCAEIFGELGWPHEFSATSLATNRASVRRGLEAAMTAAKEAGK